MVFEVSQKASPFASRPMKAGRVILLLGLALVAITSFFIPSGEAREVARIAGLPLILVGGLTYGFGRLLHASNKAPRENGPVA